MGRKGVALKPVAEAQLEAPTVNVLQIQRDHPKMKDLPAQQIKADLM